MVLGCGSMECHRCLPFCVARCQRHFMLPDAEDVGVSGMCTHESRARHGYIGTEWTLNERSQFSDHLLAAYSLETSYLRISSSTHIIQHAHRFGYQGVLRTTRPVSKLVRDRKSTRLNSSHSGESRMPSSA